MHRLLRNCLFLSIASLLFLPDLAFSQDLVIASAAGYKRPLMKIKQHYERKTGERVQAIFGNMNTILAQVRFGGQAALIFGDRSFLKKSKMKFASHTALGKGRLVLAYRKGLTLKNFRDMQSGAVRRVAFPDSTKAIYGSAAAECLNRLPYYKQIRGKLVMVSTVPQASSYLITGEVDASFLNLTDALGIKKAIGGFIEADSLLYSPIKIEVATAKGFESSPKVKAFLEFLSTAEAKSILTEYGL